ncbi:MAG TPA: DUF3667 domain-containing protein [Aeromicrobium sp.]|nr:DUF3667 domain-containing protein [Aeromicrobium sp.]
MTDTAPWTCPTCSAPVTTPYCPACGERHPRPDELTLRGLLTQAVEAFTSLDARLWRTLLELAHPGTLTVRYHHGPRKPYIGPFPLFLLTNVLFVAMELLPGSNIFSTPLDQHLHNQPWSQLARRLVAQRLNDHGVTLDAYAPVFDQAVARNAQSLVILMVLPFALLLPALFRGSRIPSAVHLAFSLHFHAFLLLFITAELLIPAADLRLGGAGLASGALDNGLAVGTLVISAVYLYFAAGRVYGGNIPSRMLKAALLATAAGVIFLGYRFTLLLVTLYTT